MPRDEISLPAELRPASSPCHCLRRFTEGVGRMDPFLGLAFLTVSGARRGGAVCAVPCEPETTANTIHVLEYCRATRSDFSREFAKRFMP